MSESIDDYPLAPLHRRLTAMLYDFLLAGSFISIITGVMSAILVWRNLEIAPESPLANLVFGLQILAGFIYLYFFWHRSGKTPGNWVWKIQTLSNKGVAISFPQAIIRYFTILILLFSGYLFGHLVLEYTVVKSLSLVIIGFFANAIWSFFNKDRLMLHEQLSGSTSIDLRR